MVDDPDHLRMVSDLHTMAHIRMLHKHPDLGVSRWLVIPVPQDGITAHLVTHRVYLVMGHSVSPMTRYAIWG